MSQSVELKAVVVKKAVVRKIKPAKAVAEPVVAEPVVAKVTSSIPTLTPEEIANHVKNRKNLVRLTPEIASQYIGDGALFITRGQYIIKEILGATEKCIQIDCPDLKDHLQLSRDIRVVPKKIVAPAVTEVKVKPTTKVVKKIKIKSIPVAVVEEPAFNKSIWLLLRRNPKVKKQLPIVWENIEDISDDENDTPQAAGKRLSTMKATRDHIRRRAYENKLAELQCAGLFINWSKPQQLETHTNYYYEAQSTYAHPICV